MTGTRHVHTLSRMDSPLITQHRTVLDNRIVYSDEVHLLPWEPPEGDAPFTSVFISKEMWEAMGEPTVVTVTVEPGDKLNGGE